MVTTSTTPRPATAPTSSVRPVASTTSIPPNSDAGRVAVPRIASRHDLNAAWSSSTITSSAAAAVAHRPVLDVAPSCLTSAW